MPEVGTRDERSPVGQLAELFRRHPVWCDAARYLEEGATSDIYFTSQPEAVWHLERKGGETLLQSGAARDPDLVFRFTPESVASLSSANGDIGDFAVRLFHLVVEAGPEGGVELRVAAPFSRLVRRGYLSLLVAGGLRVLAFGAAHGVRTVRDLRGLVDRIHHAGIAAWEAGAAAAAEDASLLDGRGLRLRIRRAARDIAMQHDRLREIVAEIHDALTEADSRRAVASAIHYRDALEAHFELEEGVVFPALHGFDARNGKAIEALLNDHVRFLAELRSLTDDAAQVETVDWKARFYELRRSLALHEAREEGLVNAEARRPG